MSLGEAVRHPVDKFVIASAQVPVFAVPSRPFRRDGVTGFEEIMIARVLFIAAAAGKFVTGRDVFQRGIGRFRAGFGMTPMGGTGLISAQMGLV